MATFSPLATQYHSIAFGENNTWDTWKLIPVTPPMVSPPAIKTQYVDVEGSDGSLDFTSALDGNVHYQRRTGTWTFYVDNMSIESFNAVVYYKQLLNALHGKEFDIVLADDPNRHYFGRLWLNEWDSDPAFSQLSLDYNLDPFHYASEADYESKTGGEL